MTVGDQALDLFQLRDAKELEGATLDPHRTVCLAELDDTTGAAALVALANGQGGFILVGAVSNGPGLAVSSIPGVDGSAAEARIQSLSRRIDPPLDDLVSVRRLVGAGGRELVLVRVRQSPHPPHLDTFSGLVYLGGGNSPEVVRSRATLDSLYNKGRAERDRAERLIEAMTERLMLAHYAYYGLGVIFCLQQPAADAYLWARTHPDALVAADDAFMEEWGFTEESARIRPAEVELRGEREVCGILRVARSGCVAIGETRRRPPGDILGSRDDLENRLGMMIETGCRILAHAEAPLVVPRLFCEGLKGMRLVTSNRPYEESSASSADMVQAPGPVGDACDPAYRGELTACFTKLLSEPFLVSEGKGHDPAR